MSQLISNTQRLGPYKNFKFRVEWRGRVVAGVSKVSGLMRITEVVKRRNGGDNNSTRKFPGRSKFDAITLERGVTHDLDFENWARKGSGFRKETVPKGFPKDVIIQAYDEAGKKAIAYKIHRCWVSEFQALPDLDAYANAVLIEHMKLENEGWET